MFVTEIRDHFAWYLLGISSRVAVLRLARLSPLFLHME